MTVETIALSNLTEATLEGAGVFDLVMRANKVHLEQQFTQGRIKGTEYATVYLGSLQTVLNASVQFLLQKNIANQDALLKDQQLLLAQIEVQKAQAQLAQIQEQTLMLQVQRDGVVAENAIKTQQALNAVIEGQVLNAQLCKLQAEYDVIILSKQKVVSETALLDQKKLTERAQIDPLGVAADSVLGKQMALYAAQASGFQRDAEQKAAKLLADVWAVRRTTDTNATAATATNKFDDITIGAAVGKMLAGIGVAP